MKFYSKLNDTDRKNLTVTAALFAAFILFTILIKFVDVAAIGPQGSKVGFAAINGFFAKILPYRKVFYKIAEVLGLVVLLFVAGFGLLGVWQLIRRKSIWAVDTRILLLGVFYVIVFVLYILFDKIPLNYRPVIIDPAEGLEASFPSSHTMLAICVMGTALMQTRYYLGPVNPLWVRYGNYICLGLMLLVVLFRFLSGVHWFTDILGGILLSLALVNLYKFFLVMSEGSSNQRGAHEKR